MQASERAEHFPLPHFPIHSMKEGLPGGRLSMRSWNEVWTRIETKVREEVQVEVKTGPRTGERTNALRDERARRCAKRFRGRLSEVSRTHPLRPARFFPSLLSEELPDELSRELHEEPLSRSEEIGTAACAALRRVSIDSGSVLSRGREKDTRPRPGPAAGRLQRRVQRPGSDRAVVRGTDALFDRGRWGQGRSQKAECRR